MAALKSYCLLIVTSLFITSHCQYMTVFDQHFKIECPEGEVIKSLESVHDNDKEDREWNMYCAPPPGGVTLSACEWSGYANDFDAVLEYECVDERVMAGIEAIHDNHHEDRRFGFKCCVPDGAVAHGCQLTPYVNDYDQVLNYRVPDGYVMTGVDSVHDNHHEDRIFRFDICQLDVTEEIPVVG